MKLASCLKEAKNAEVSFIALQELHLKPDEDLKELKHLLKDWQAIILPAETAHPRLIEGGLMQTPFEQIKQYSLDPSAPSFSLVHAGVGLFVNKQQGWELDSA